MNFRNVLDGEVFVCVGAGRDGESSPHNTCTLLGLSFCTHHVLTYLHTILISSGLKCFWLSGHTDAPVLSQNH